MAAELREGALLATEKEASGITDHGSEGSAGRRINGWREQQRTRARRRAVWARGGGQPRCTRSGSRAGGAAVVAIQCIQCHEPTLSAGDPSVARGSQITTRESVKRPCLGQWPKR
jgi:mono/diheme cytochrome c family protein